MATVEGRVVYTGRNALDRLVAPTEAQRLHRRAERLSDAADATQHVDE